MATATKPSKPSKKKSGKKKKAARKPKLTSTELQEILAPNGVADDELFELWVKHLRLRKKPVAISQLFDSAGLKPLRWCLNEPAASILKQSKIITGVHKSLRKLERPSKSKKSVSRKAKKGASDSIQLSQARLKAWLDHDSETPTMRTAFEALYLGHFLPKMAGLISNELWNRILHYLVRVCEKSNRSEDTLINQLLSVELPLTIAYHLPEVESCKRLAQVALLRLVDDLESLVASEAIYAAKELPNLQPMLACWVRVQLIVKSMKGLKLPKESKQQFADFLRHNLRVICHDRSVSLSADSAPNDPELEEAFIAAVKFLGNEKDKSLVKHVIHKRDVSDDRLPAEPCFHSEAAGIAYLHPDWSPKAPRVAFDFSTLDTRLEISANGKRLTSTDWMPEFRVNGTALFPESDVWKVVCWYTDYDVDYLELEWKFAGNWVVQRQVVMARQDHFLILADNLSGPETVDIDYRMHIPLFDGISPSQPDESREILLAGKRPLATVLPLALSEWQSDPRGGSFSSTGNAIELRQWGNGKAMCAPLFIDLHRNRIKRPLTWRQLTVAENLGILAKDDAVGYRVQAGPEQWLFYRTLASRGNRTVLGQNTASEFICARFLHDGQIEPIVEIE